jgi:hypothetical protein
VVISIITILAPYIENIEFEFLDAAYTQGNMILSISCKKKKKKERIHFGVKNFVLLHLTVKYIFQMRH